MNKSIGFAVAFLLLCGDMSIAAAAEVGGWVTCRDGMKMHGGGSCENHGGELIEATKSTPIPIDTNKGLTPNKTTTKKTNTQTTATAAATKKKPVSKKTNSPTARCNDGAMYFSTERRGACAKHGGVRHWY